MNEITIFDKRWMEEDLSAFTLWKLPRAGDFHIYRITAVIEDRTAKSHFGTTFLQIVAEGHDDATMRLWAAANGIDIANDKTMVWGEDGPNFTYVITL